MIKQGSLLEVASYCGSLDCVHYLVENGADIDKRDEVLISSILVFDF